MNVLVAISIAPFGIGDELSKEVSQVISLIEDSGLNYRLGSMFTEIEGEWDEVMDLVKSCTMILAERGIRTELVLKADVRPGYKNMLNEKVTKVQSLLGKKC